MNGQPKLASGLSGKKDGSNGMINNGCTPRAEKSAMSCLRSEEMSEAAVADAETEEDKNPFITKSKRKKEKQEEKQAEEQRKVKTSKIKKKQGITFASWNTRGKRD